MAISKVQSNSAAQITGVDPRATQRIYVTTAFASPNTAGNCIVVAVSGGTPAGPLNVPQISDSAGNTYTQIDFHNGQLQVPAIGLYIATNIHAWTGNIVTFSMLAENDNPIFGQNFEVTAAAMEVHGLGIPALHSHGLLSLDAGSADLEVTIPNLAAVDITTDKGNNAQAGLVVADWVNGGADFFVAAERSATNSGFPTTVPAVTPGLFSYELQENPSSGGNYVLALFTTVLPLATTTPTISCGSPPGGTQGVPYTHTFPASDGVTPYTFSIISGALPDGLTLDSATGIVSGTPTTAGTFGFTIQVTDAADESDNVGCSITIASSFSVSCGNPPSALTGAPYSHTFVATGGTPLYTYSLFSGSLPPGLTLASNGLLSGIPTTTGTFIFVIQATDADSTTAITGGCSIGVTSGCGCLIQFAYWEEGESVTSELLLGLDGNVYQVGGTSDNGTPINVQIGTPYINSGQSRSQKFYRDLMMDADPQGVDISIQQRFTLGVVSLAAQIIAGAARAQFPLNTANGNGQLGLNIGAFIEWSSAVAAPTIWEWQPNGYDTNAMLRTSWASLPTSHGGRGWQHIREGYVPVLMPDAGPLQLIVTVDGVALPPIPLNPTVSGQIQKLRFDATPNKGLMFEYQIAPSTLAFLIFEKDLEVEKKDWGSNGHYDLIRPFGDDGP